jgi:CDK inhibitor PHO81
LPEYAASFLDYKALKKVLATLSRNHCSQLTCLQLIKHLSATPTLAAQNAFASPQGTVDPKIALRANKEVFFFRLVCTNVGAHEYKCS